MSNEETERWRRCSSCKKDIAFSQIYWVCNVSTCNRKRTGTVFCTVSCCEVHVPIMNHREAWAVEKTAPNREAWRREQAAAGPSSRGNSTSSKPSPAAGTPQRTIIRRSAGGATSEVRLSTPPTATPSTAVDDPTAALPREDVPREILIVASKLKNYIKAVSGMNTSDAVLEMLSDHVRALCDKAIRTAREDERKTVMDRDYPKP